MSFEKIVSTFIVLFLILYACAGAAYPQTTQCAPYANLSAHLAEKYGEAMVWQGNQSPDAVIQLWSNAGTETWTVVVFRADGVGCFVASGTGMATFAPPPAGTEG